MLAMKKGRKKGDSYKVNQVINLLITSTQRVLTAISALIIYLFKRAFLLEQTNYFT